MDRADALEHGSARAAIQQRPDAAAVCRARLSCRRRPGSASADDGRVSPANSINASRELEQHWSEIHFGEATGEVADGQLSVSVPVYLGEIQPHAVRVELYAEPQGEEEPLVVQMKPTAPVAGIINAALYHVTIRTSRPPWHFTPRVVPFHPEARVPIEITLIAWQH